ncbi:CopG domain protein DNA-binding domain protein [Tolypothrix tenuis PCC 7101]|uniref:CopG domain protein DNA-binding domain protein n=1 Tax=Tolypothrix tenuis PCC 7101 TaxID=231146 RepID=A0A1Z4MUV3_9CYAN|nr:CopG domain protein DNA-binding domain protein [Tolypothrix tenuis PCC 7101]BAZ72233.1 CopG domain protein DNA-binding domain protein [Aulosira laxa NIES-50]
MHNFIQGKRGAIEPTPPSKTCITIRLDDELKQR